MAISDKSKVIKRSDKTSPLTQIEVDSNFQEVRNVIDDATNNESLIEGHKANLASKVAGKGSDLVGHTGTAESVTEALDKRTIYAGSVAELEALDTSALPDGQHFIVKAYDAGTGVGGGVFYWDETATETENRITIFGAGVSGRFKRPVTSEIPITWGGAASESTDNTTAVQAVFDLCHAQQKTVFIDSGTFLVTGVGIQAKGVRIKGAGQRQSYLKNAAGTVLRPEGVVNVTDVQFQSNGGGSTISQDNAMFESLWERVSIVQTSTNYPLWQNNGNLYIEIRMFSCELIHVENAVAHGFNMTKGGFVNNNLWKNCRASYSGKHFFNLESADSTPNYHNSWEGVNFQYCLGGGIRQQGAVMFRIIDCSNWDAQNFGTIKDHFYLLDSNLDTVVCRGLISGCGRWAGVNAAGIKDIMLCESPLGFGTVIENCYSISVSEPFEADAQGNSIHVRNGSSGRFTVINDGAAFVEDYQNGVFNKLRVTGVLESQTSFVGLDAELSGTLKVGGGIYNRISENTLPSSYTLLTLDSNNALKLIVKVGNASGNYIYQEWFITHGFVGVSSASKLIEHKTSDTNSSDVSITIDSATGVVTVSTSGGTGLKGQFNFVRHQ